VKELFLSEINQKKLFANGDKILLAVSGGVDSMVMLHLFQECGFNIGIAHANFQLRGDESEGDEKFVEAVCKKNSIPFFNKKFETEDYAKSNHLSIQMAARELRYEWFNELLTEKCYDFLATAHHLNDSIETVLLNFVRGSGLEGFDGIASKNGKIIRPMLFATRLEIENYAKENKIGWREDRSNATDDYSRNFIRHQVSPLLKELNPSLERTFDESINKISGAVELMEIGAEQWRQKFERKKDNQILLDKKGFELIKNPESILWILIKGFGFNFDQSAQIIAALNGQSGKRFSSSQFELVIDRDHLIMSKNQIELTETLIEVNQTEASLGNFKMKIEKKEKVNFKNDPSIAFLDADKLTFPLRWRKWKPGDSFHPLGMNHKKKLSDFLIDQKISVADKESITVLEMGNEIVWVIGYRIDERFKVVSSTVSTVVCRLSSVD
jgi:tRNA(Ile)-lysidine synthase